MFCSDRMNGSHFILQKSKFEQTDATALTLGQGHGKVIQYIFLDPYILCPKYLTYSWNGFDVRGKSRCGGGCSGGGHGRNEWLNDVSETVVSVTKLKVNDTVHSIKAVDCGAGWSEARFWNLCYITWTNSLAPGRYLWNLNMWHLNTWHDDVMKWNIFPVTAHLCGQFTGPRWIPHTKASDAELWCFLWSASE